MVIVYGEESKEPVIAKRNNTVYQLEFHILDIDTTYFFFEDEESKGRFVKSHTIEGEELPLVKDRPIQQKGAVAKLAIKIKLVDANHCPGSCMFLFWIYRVEKDCVLKPDLYIYTGDYFLTDNMKEKLIELRKSEDVETLTIVNDFTRSDKKDYGFSTLDEAIDEINKFYNNHREKCKTLITVKIGAYWGMEDLWIKLAGEYDTTLRFCDNREILVRRIMGEECLKSGTENSKKEEKDKEVM